MTSMRAAPSRLIRSIAFAAVLGGLVAASAVFVVSRSGSLDVIAGRRDVSETAEAKLAVEEWPICSSIRSETDWADLDPDFANGKRALAKREWTNAITALEFAAVRDPWNADIQNYIGYAYRELRQLGPAMGHFQQALLLNPRHRGAHEHLGELLLALNEPALAEEHVTALKEICLIPCEELGNLQQAIEVGRSFSTR